MQGTLFVREMNRFGCGLHDLGRPPRCERFFANRFRQTMSVDEIHGEIVPPIVLTDLMHRHDVRVLQPTSGLGLTLPENGLTSAYADGGYVYWTDFLFQGMFAATAATMVEYFRDEKKQDVLFFADNVFRFLQAGSENAVGTWLCQWVSAARDDWDLDARAHAA